MSSDKTKFISNLKQYIHDNDDFLDERYYEWEVIDWDNKLKKGGVVNGPQFRAFGYLWHLELCFNKMSSIENYISVYLQRDDDFNDFSVHIPMNQVYFIKNPYDYSCYQCATLPTVYYNNDFYGWGHSLLVRKEKLNVKQKDTGKSFVENNKCVIGIYCRIYNYHKELYKYEIINSLYSETARKNLISNDFYEYKIEDWSKFNLNQYISFDACGYKWQLRVNYSKTNGYLSIYLKCLSKLGLDLLITKPMIFIRNYDHPECFCYRSLIDCDKDYRVIKSFELYGSERMFNKNELFTINKQSNVPIIENNKCVIGAYIQIYEDEKQFPYEGINLLSNIYRCVPFDINNKNMGKYDKGKLLKEIRDKIEKEERQKIEKEVREKIEKEIREKVEKEVREKIEREEREKVKQEKPKANSIPSVNYVQYPQYPSYYPPPPPMYYPQNQNPVPGQSPPPYQSPVSPGQNPYQNSATPHYYYPPNPSQNPSVPMYYYPASPGQNPAQSVPPVPPVQYASPSQSPVPTSPNPVPVNPNTASAPSAPPSESPKTYY